MTGSVVSSITRFGTYEPFELQVARGQITMHESISVFGYSTVVGATAYPIWNVAANRPYVTTATVLKISSSSADDDSAGTGARTIAIYGLDQNYNAISESVILDGQTEVNTGNSYLRVSKIVVTSVGSGGFNAGVIYAGTGTVTAGVPAVIHELVPINFNASMSGVYTVPAGYTAYVYQGGLTSQSNGNNYLTGRLKTSNQGSPKTTNAVTIFTEGMVDYNFTCPLKLPEKTDLEACATVSANTSTATSFFFIILVKNDGQP